MTNAIATQEAIRDLRKQIDGLSRADENEVVFEDVSKSKGFITLYRMLDGEPVRMTMELASTAINKLGPRGPQWTTKQEEAPAYVEGKMPCFLHADAPEREVLAGLGLPPTCEQGKLRNAQAKRVHAIHCHKDEWAAYQDYLSDETIRTQNERQDAQISATLALAERAAGPAPRIVSSPLSQVQPIVSGPTTTTASHPNAEPEYFTTDVLCECGWSKGKNAAGLALHKRMHCPLREGA